MGKRRSTGSFEVERTTGSHEVLDRLFVYGTLRQGQTARSLLANSIVRCLPAHTMGQIYAFPMGYPGFTDGAGHVVGELLWLTDLAATFGLLDAYEGQDFARVITQVTTGEGEEVWSWIYTLSDRGAIKLGTLIADGDCGTSRRSSEQEVANDGHRQSCERGGKGSETDLGIGVVRKADSFRHVWSIPLWRA
jgi:gamma-glutamylcyclotransferase (GGCT)/AIG2-like uncharacterized protein YtfP